MQIAHTVQTDDGSLRLALGDGDSIFDLVACGANGQEVTVHLGYHEAQRLLCGAGTVRIALNSADRARVIALVTPTLGGVADRAQPEGAVTFVVAAGSDVYRLDVVDGGGAVTALTFRSGAHDSLIVGISTMLSQL